MSPNNQAECPSVSMTSLAKIITPLLVPVLVGIGSSAITATIATARLEERVSNLERKADSHARTETDLRSRDNEYERRISRVEALFEGVDKRLVEISGDVKTILKMERGK